MRRRTTTPKRKRTTGKTRRKTRNWINPSSGYTSFKNRAPITVPDSMFVCLVYADVLDSVTAVAQTNDLVYRANSCFAPNFSTARQPNGFDQFAAFYGRYRVYASSIDVTIATTSTTNFSIFSVVPNTDPTFFTSYNDGVDAVRSKTTQWVTENGTTSQRLTHYATTMEILGLTRREMDDDTTAAQTSANPVKLWYWHTIVHTTTGGLSYASQTKIKYYVEFYGRVALGSS